MMRDMCTFQAKYGTYLKVFGKRKEKKKIKHTREELHTLTGTTVTTNSKTLYWRKQFIWGWSKAPVLQERKEKQLC